MAVLTGSLISERKMQSALWVEAMLTAVVSAQSVLGSRAICPFPIRGRRFHACCSTPALHASRASTARAQITDAFASRQWCLSNNQLIQTLESEVLCRNRTYFGFLSAYLMVRKRRIDARDARLAQQNTKIRTTGTLSIAENAAVLEAGNRQILFQVPSAGARNAQDIFSEAIVRTTHPQSSRRQQEPGTRYPNWVIGPSV